MQNQGGGQDFVTQRFTKGKGHRVFPTLIKVLPGKGDRTPGCRKCNWGRNRDTAGSGTLASKGGGGGEEKKEVGETTVEKI